MENESLKNTKNNLKEFTDWILSQTFEGLDVEGGDIQDMALKFGLIEEYEATEPCSDNCACAEITEFPTKCYRKTYL